MGSIIPSYQYEPEDEIRMNFMREALKPKLGAIDRHFESKMQLNENAELRRRDSRDQLKKRKLGMADSNTEGNQKLNQSVKEAILENILGGKGRFRDQNIGVQDIIKGNIPDLNTWEATPADKLDMTTEENIPIGSEEMMQARYLGSLTPDAALENSDFKHLAQKTGGFMGFGSKAQFTEDGSRMIEDAKAMVANPYRKKTQVTKYGGGRAPIAPAAAPNMGTSDIVRLMDEYEQTNDPAKAQQIEAILKQMGLLQ